ncbi:MAG: hypothetical protein ACJ8F7_17860 [Gemmataceae bacterium]
MVSALPSRRAHVPLNQVGDRSLEVAVVAVVAGVILPDVVRIVRRLLPVQSDILTWGAVGCLMLLPVLSRKSRARPLPRSADPDAVARFEGEGGSVGGDSAVLREPTP